VAHEINQRESKGSAKADRREWMHLLNVGNITEGMAEWEDLSLSERRQRQSSQKERKFRANNPNFAIDPLRLSVRNLPRSVNASKLREAVVAHLTERAFSDKKSAMAKKELKRIAEASIAKASLVRDGDRRTSENERRSKGFGFIAFKDHKSAMRTLEYLNNNPKIFGGNRRPIVEFAIEDKRKLRMQQELYRKHGHKLLQQGPEKEGAADAAKGKGKGKGKGKAAAEGSGEAEGKGKGKGKDGGAAGAAAKAKKNKRKEGESRGRRQRERRRAEKAAQLERAAYKAAKSHVNNERQQAIAAEKRAERQNRPKTKRKLPDAGLPDVKRKPKRQGELDDDFELKAMARFRGGF